jgi:hypothetical protein
MLMRHKAGHPFLFIHIYPPIERVGVPRLQQPLACYGMGRCPRRNLEERAAPLADIGPRIMIAIVLQFPLLSRL